MRAAYKISSCDRIGSCSTYVDYCIIYNRLFMLYRDNKFTSNFKFNFFQFLESKTNNTTSLFNIFCFISALKVYKFLFISFISFSLFSNSTNLPILSWVSLSICCSSTFSYFLPYLDTSSCLFFINSFFSLITCSLANLNCSSYNSCCFCLFLCALSFTLSTASWPDSGLLFFIVKFYFSFTTGFTYWCLSSFLIISSGYPISFLNLLILHSFWPLAWLLQQFFYFQKIGF